jgi:hypothetical protein
MNRFHIGLDLDNTIISYDESFVEVGTELGMLPAGTSLTTKDEVKIHLCSRDHGVRTWMELQGQVYGRYIERARLFPGVAECLRHVGRLGGRISIVSHKTRYGHFDAAQVNLWDAAFGWMTDRRFFDLDGFGLDRDDVHFCETREDKIDVIGEIGCDAYVDDLLEVLLAPNFPSRVERIWFAADKIAAEDDTLKPHRNWAEINHTIGTLLSA